MDATYRDSEAREPNWPVRSPDTLFDSSLGVSSVAKKIVKGLVFFYFLVVVSLLRIFGTNILLTGGIFGEREPE